MPAELPDGSARKTPRSVFAKNNNNNGVHNDAVDTAPGTLACSFFSPHADRSCQCCYPRQLSPLSQAAFNGLFSYAPNGHKLSAGYQPICGDSAFPDVEINDFSDPQERSWQARYPSYFAKLG